MLGVSIFAQWTPTTVKRDSKRTFTSESYFKLDLNKMRSDLKNAPETGTNAKPVEISVPTLKGTIEKFAVYSFPVMSKDLAAQYELGSYVGVGIDDPSKQIRFSVAPNDFQAMIIKGGVFEFIDPLSNDKTIYSVHPKTKDTQGKSFVCSTKEGTQMANQIEKLSERGNFFSNQHNNYSKNSDKKYRTMRLAISTTSSYVAYTGGTLSSALAQINATMTRVNGVFEKDFALHLNVINAPGIIFVDSSTDPYLTLPGTLNAKLQQVLTTNVGDANYDIGHVFNAAGNNGNAGCIGCVCIDPTSAEPLGKGSGFTQSTAPSGDNFDIDYVAHEMGHQLGANHTFSYSIEGSGVNMEPGSGSTIMGYAGITNANVQMHSDAYFHVASILQVQNNLSLKDCDVEVPITNNPPAIVALPTYNIPKGTAFVLTASATDPENDPLTYTWEEFDDAGAIVNGQITGGTITANNLGNTTYGASFRSLMPSTSPTRYFPKLSSVMNGVLNNSNSQWESVSNVARTSSYVVTVRDNNPNFNQQQTKSALQNIIVGSNGPFKVNTQYANVSLPTPIEWDVVGTNTAPYNVSNVKIDYTTDNGNTWTLLSASTANDGTENFTFPVSMDGQLIKVRVSSIGNVFYAVNSVKVAQFGNCGSSPTGITMSNITTSSANVSWVPVSGASSYVLRYKKVSETNWITLNLSNNNAVLANLLDNTAYEVQVSSVCSGVTGAFSASTNFNTTQMPAYCSVSSGAATDDYISNVTLANVNNSSNASTYTSYVSDPSLQINLIAGNTYTLSVTRAYLQSGIGPYPAATSVWIDFNRNGVFENSERILTSLVAPNTPNPLTTSFTVPMNAVQGLGLRMRVGMLYSTSSGAGIVDACGSYVNNLGEFEDYNIVVSANPLSTHENTTKNNEIKIYPNPATDVLNITKVSDNSKFDIYNAVGQLVKTGEIKGNKVVISELVKGAYIITVKDKDISEKLKFIKK